MNLRSGPSEAEITSGIHAPHQVHQVAMNQGCSEGDLVSPVHRLNLKQTPHKNFTAELSNRNVWRGSREVGYPHSTAALLIWTKLRHWSMPIEHMALTILGQNVLP